MTDRLIRITTALAVVAVAIISHQHAYELVRSHGVGRRTEGALEPAGTTGSLPATGRNSGLLVRAACSRMTCRMVGGLRSSWSSRKSSATPRTSPPADVVSAGGLGDWQRQPVVTAKICMAEVLEPIELLISGKVTEATVLDESIGTVVAYTYIVIACDPPLTMLR